MKIQAGWIDAKKILAYVDQFGYTALILTFVLLKEAYGLRGLNKSLDLYITIGEL